MNSALRWIASVFLTSALSGCGLLSAATDLLLEGHSLTVINNCLGPNTTVNFYLDGGYRGTVYTSRTFLGLSTRTYTLRAQGTGAGGSVFQRSLYIDSDMRWTLCP